MSFSRIGPLLSGRLHRHILLRLQYPDVEFRDVGIQRSAFESGKNSVASLCGINDGVDPKAGGGIAAVGLLIVGGLDRGEEFLLLFVAEFFAAAFELADTDLNQGVGG